MILLNLLCGITPSHWLPLIAIHIFKHLKKILKMLRNFYRVFLCSIAIITLFSCKQPPKKEADTSARFHAMLESYWQGLMRLQPLDATQFGDSSMNDQFQNTCTKAYRDEVKHFYSATRIA
jgi:hypothetical protein